MNFVLAYDNTNQQKSNSVLTPREFALLEELGAAGSDGRILHEDYKPRLIWFAHMMGVRGPDCSDLVQEVFLAAIRQIRAGNFRQDSSIVTWLDGILKHKIQDWWRSLNRYQFEITEDEDRQSDEKSAVWLSHRWDEDLDVQTVLSRMPNDLRLILLLNEIEGLTVQEISQWLNKPAGTIGRKLAAAKDILRAEFSAPR
jgi:RNA polymerase sigma-70 factor (ECF subfamily)